jgi:hypothetical protein
MIKYGNRRESVNVNVTPLAILALRDRGREDWEKFELFL